MNGIKALKRRVSRLLKKSVSDEDRENESVGLESNEERKCIRWTIENVYRYPLVIGEYYESPTFWAGHSNSSKWTLRLYPREQTSTNLEKVGLFIKRISSSETCSDSHEFKVEDSFTIEAYFLNQSVLERIEGYGTDEFYLDDLWNVKFMTIQCDILITLLEAEKYQSNEKGFSACLLSTQMKEILGSGKFSDVTLQAGKKQFRAHKAVLAARSTVFAAMFDHPMEESETSHVHIEDVEPQVLADLLQYVYSGSVDDLTVEKATALFGAADKYCLKELQAKCVRVMLAKLCAQNVCQIAVLADMHSEQRLKTATNYVFRKYKHEIFDTKEWKTMTHQRPLLAGEILQNVSTEFHTKCFDPSANGS